MNEQRSRRNPPRRNPRRRSTSKSPKAPAPTEGGDIVDEHNDNNKDDLNLKRRARSHSTDDSSSNNDGDKDGEDHEPGPPSPETVQKKARLRRELDQLHQEMEVAQYARTAAGQTRRRVPRNQIAARTVKRKALERKDHVEYAIFGERDGHKRASRKSLETEVLQASLIFPVSQQQQPGSNNSDGEEEEENDVGKEEEENDVGKEEEEEEDNDIEEDGEEDDNEEYGEEEDMYQEEEGDGEEDDVTVVMVGDGVLQVEEEIIDEEEEEEPEADQKELDDAAAAAAGPRISKKKRQTVNRNARKRLYRLRNFKSHRMAQSHGQALAFLVQGKPQMAIEKLKQVAKDAPKAPQIYSSLGMVYEDMLRQAKRKRRQRIEAEEEQQRRQKNEDKQDENNGTQDKESDQKKDQARNSSTTPTCLIPDLELAEQVDLAKRAYGAYHAAAILCRRDFSFWVRSAEMALQIAGLQNEIMTIVNDASLRCHFINERRRWLNEAKNDYHAADNLKPPGIDIPCKLAALQMELGLLSEALTLLTDLKNRPTKEGGRSQFEINHNAWVLYADLMLRTGHECVEWNNGNLSNDNYMTRRWLRKWSGTFDWRERRLQALARALEAAAGTKSCRALLAWLQKRAVTIAEAEQNLGGDKYDEPHEDKHETSNNDATGESRHEESGETNHSNGTNKNKIDADETFLLEQKSKRDLDNFDKTTADLGLEHGSKAALERAKVRDQLVDKMNSEKLVAQIVHETLDGEYSASALWKKDAEELPLRASIRTVCAIAADLMRLLLDDVELCHGCRLVGEAVSLYFKERAARIEQRQQAHQRYMQTNGFWIDPVLDGRQSSGATGGTVGEEEDMSDSENDGPLSDDDEFDNDQHKSFLESLKRGVLPPSLLFMYGLALAGIGGRDFLARKCLESVVSVEPEDSTWLSSRLDDKETTPETRWDAFRLEHAGQLGRTQAFAFIAHVLETLGKEKQFADTIISFFTNQEAFVTSSGFVEECRKIPLFACPLQELKIGAVVSTVVAAVRYRTRILSKKLAGEADQDIFTNLLRSVQTVSIMMPGFWKLNTDKTLSPVRMSVLSTVAEAFRLLVEEAEKPTSRLDPDEVIRCINSWLSVICGHTPMNLLADHESESDTAFSELPFHARWQSLDQYRITLKCYNLAVARNVSYFSGWDEREFNGSLNQLRRRVGPAFYGITTAEGHVAGYLSPSVFCELMEQWGLFARRVLPSAQIVSKLTVLNLGSWYSELERKVVNFEKHNKIAMHGEDDAISIMLSFSRMSISMMKRSLDSTSDKPADLGLMNALSVLLPLTQFCLNEKMWECGIGSEAASRSPEEWQRLVTRTANDGVPRPSERAGYLKPSRRTGDGQESNMDWFLGEDVDEPLSNLVLISKASLSGLWKEIAVKPLCTEPTAAESMEILHKCMLRMRKSFTEVAVERASLEVASAILQIASYPECENGFICLQHAALFAGQALKEGSSDLNFKVPLPEREVCTPHEALMILGRADCLQALHFYQEAAFLCGFVASVCAMHRQNSNDMMDEKWTMVSIMAYNTSVLIRYAGLQVLQNEEKKLFEFAWWDSATKEELCRGRQDGIALSKKDNGPHQSGFLVPKVVAPKASSPKVEKLENVKASAPEDGKLENIESADPVIEEAEYPTEFEEPEYSDQVPVIPDVDILDYDQEEVVIVEV